MIPNDHIVNEIIIQRGSDKREGTYRCSCGRSVTVDLTKKPRPVALKELGKLHDEPAPKPKKVKKIRKQKPVIETSTENDPEIDAPEEPAGGWLNESEPES